MMSVFGRRLAARTALAFVAVALAAELVFALVAFMTDRADVASLASGQRAEVTQAVMSATQNAYAAKGGWPGADLRPVVALVDPSGAALAIYTAAGAQVLGTGQPSLFSSATAAHAHQSLYWDGKLVGSLKLAFPAGGLDPAGQRLRSALFRSLALSAGLGALVALVVGLVAANGLARPIRKLSAAAQAFASGIRGVRVAQPRAPEEIADLARAFNQMAVALERHEELRKAMVADVAHELRTPAAILQAETELLVDGTTVATPKILLSLHEETLRLTRLIEDFQTLASADAAGLRLERAPVDLAEVARDVAGSLENRFTAGEVMLVRDLMPAVTWGDPNRLHQVVANLLGNAAKFTPAGGTVRLVVRPEEGGACLQVSDTGPGIPVEEQERIFERFFRGQSGHAAGGSGIGLAVVKDLVEAHGGHVLAQNVLPHGACFVVFLPGGAEAPGMATS